MINDIFENDSITYYNNNLKITIPIIYELYEKIQKKKRKKEY